MGAGAGRGGGTAEAGLPSPDVTSRPPPANHEFPRPLPNSAPLCSSPSFTVHGFLSHRFHLSVLVPCFLAYPHPHNSSCLPTPFLAAPEWLQFSSDVFWRRVRGLNAGNSPKKLAFTSSDDLIVADCQRVFRSALRDSLGVRATKATGQRQVCGLGCRVAGDLWNEEWSEETM